VTRRYRLDQINDAISDLCEEGRNIIVDARATWSTGFEAREATRDCHALARKTDVAVEQAQHFDVT
jgi:hypothetical protein